MTDGNGIFWIFKDTGQEQPRHSLSVDATRRHCKDAEPGGGRGRRGRGGGPAGVLQPDALGAHDAGKGAFMLDNLDHYYTRRTRVSDA